MTTLLLLLQGADIGSNVVVDGAVDPGALAFLLGSWAFVLGLMTWAFTKILRVKARRDARPPPPPTVDERVSGA